jgi:hypothetical protein
MLGRSSRHLLWKSPDSFAAEFCTRCKAGWTRRAKKGALTVCLLDREPVLAGMTSCDRFEPRQQPHPKEVKPKAAQEILLPNSKR